MRMAAPDIPAADGPFAPLEHHSCYYRANIDLKREASPAYKFSFVFYERGFVSDIRKLCPKMQWKTVCRRDAAAEPPWTGSRRVLHCIFGHNIRETYNSPKNRK